MMTAIIQEQAEEFADMWSDPKHSVEQSMVTDFFTHMASTSFLVWSNVFSSQLMTRDFFNMMGIVMQTDAKEGETNEALNKLETYTGKLSSKQIPLATQWRWQNKVIAEGEAQIMTWTDHMKTSTPYALLHWINEQMDKKNLNPIISKTFNLDQIVDAHKYLAEGNQLGKTVVVTT